jgi:ligand-binding SRPBCC domain-containing protein
MKLFELRRKQLIPADIDKIWDFFSNPLNLSRITPPEMNFRITSSFPEKVYTGLLLSYTVSPICGVPLKWTTEITYVEKPHMFVDEQRVGPYRFWRHRHFFRAVSGGVEVEDNVAYALRFDPLSRPINDFIVRKRLEKIFDYRREAIIKIFGEP